jgi:hypothetical protein
MKRTLLLAAFLLLGNVFAFAQSADEKAVATAVEKLRVAIIAAE